MGSRLNPVLGGQIPVSEAKSDVGVLYVPGVGPDDPSEDLQRVADTVALWLDDWLSEGSGAAARTGLPNDVDWARSQTTADSEQPAHTVLSASLGTVGQRTRLTIAVSRWQSTLGKPTRRTVATWLIRLMPMLVLEHFHAALFQAAALGRSRRLRRLARVVVSLAAFLAALPLAAVLLTVLLVIVGISYLPLPGVGAVARAAETWFARMFGYSLALSESPTRFLSAVDVAATELSWLADRCCRVVVVGFSQGAVVAHEVIRRRAPVNLALLATVGSALRTFYEMPLLASGRSTYWRTLGTIVVAFPFIAIYCVTLPILIFSHRPANIGGLLGSMGALLLMALYGSVGLALLADALRAGRPLRAAHRLRLPGAGERFTWVDYAATADPIPQGALIEDVDAARFGGWPAFMSVSNEAALWRDHHLYWANRDEFLPDLIGRILAAGGVDVCQSGDDELLERCSATTCCQSHRTKPRPADRCGDGRCYRHTASQHLDAPRYGPAQGHAGSAAAHGRHNAQAVRTPVPRSTVGCSAHRAACLGRAVHRSAIRRTPFVAGMASSGRAPVVRAAALRYRRAEPSGVLLADRSDRRSPSVGCDR